MPETITKYNFEVQRIPVKRYSKIRKAPDYHCIQLIRFEFDLNLLIRVKVNSEYESPKSFNLAKCTENEDEPQIYDLTGVIVHNGTTEGGHYTSYILVDGVWTCFNYHNVSTVTKAEFRKNSIGSTGPTSWPLLFYTKHGI